MLCQSSFIKHYSGSSEDYQPQLSTFYRRGWQPSAAPVALLTAERVQTQLGLLMTPAHKKQEENSVHGKDHLPDCRAQTVRCSLANLATVIPALKWLWELVQVKNNQSFFWGGGGAGFGSRLLQGLINNFTRTTEGGHRLGMSSWGLLRCHRQWMAPLPWIFTETELERSDNQPWHLRYGSSTKQMGQYLLKVL